MKIKPIFKLLGLTHLITSFILILYTFITAYFNDYSVLVMINRYNEAHFELFFLLSGLPCVGYFVYDYTKKYNLKEEIFIQ